MVTGRHVVCEGMQLEKEKPGNHINDRRAACTLCRMLTDCDVNSNDEGDLLYSCKG